ncbi:CAMK protein kinase, variant [Aphanomyces invadans]|nr:CAMK protein kinase, variant [Aphanomyces invadans]ETW04532.1 CAMK protein kinase, variant [Aphanomyces invadans]|eukprot:XP_008867488.1 CAMK protein kinase, variant [Aphanomyces invadans]
MAILMSLPPHPSIVNLLEYFEHDGMLCLVLEYCAFGELFDHLARHNQRQPHLHPSQPQRMSQPSPNKTPPAYMSERQAATWFRQIVDGVRHIHANGIAHRDLSLENVLLDANQHCRICDFGLSSREGKSCLGRVGKTFYMAPEVYFGDHQRYNGFKADIWSLGILLFILLSGIPPLEVPSEIDARFRIIRQEGVQELAKMWGLAISNEALDLLSFILRARPEERPSLDEILSHPWFETRWVDGVTGNRVVVA